MNQYAGGFIYENGQLKMFSTPEGYVEPNGNGGFNYVYNYLDHLGNVRLTYADSDGNGSIDASTEIISEKNYYPFGLLHRGYNNVVSANANSIASKFKYNGKELEESLGYDMHEYEARHYDAALGRFVTIDPLSEDYSFQSPYAYAVNNPIFFIDKFGMGPDWINNGDGTWTAEDGDSAATLAKDAGISFERANELVQAQHGKNRVDANGNEFSNIDPEAVVAIPEQQQEIATVASEMECVGVAEVSTDGVSTDDGKINNLGDLQQLFDDLGDIPDITPIGEAETFVESMVIYEEEGLNAMLYNELANAQRESRGYSGRSGKSRSRQGFSTKKSKKRRTRNARANTSTKSKAKPARKKNSWNQFLQQNKGKYKGKDWIKKAAADYRAQTN